MGPSHRGERGDEHHVREIAVLLQRASDLRHKTGSRQATLLFSWMRSICKPACISHICVRCAQDSLLKLLSGMCNDRLPALHALRQGERQRDARPILRGCAGLVDSLRRAQAIHPRATGRDRSQDQAVRNVRAAHSLRARLWTDLGAPMRCHERTLVVDARACRAWRALVTACLSCGVREP